VTKTGFNLKDPVSPVSLTLIHPHLGHTPTTETSFMNAADILAARPLLGDAGDSVVDLTPKRNMPSSIRSNDLTEADQSSAWAACQTTRGYSGLLSNFCLNMPLIKRIRHPLRLTHWTRQILTQALVDLQRANQQSLTDMAAQKRKVKPWVCRIMAIYEEEG
jgi:hypothetical protein